VKGLFARLVARLPEANMNKPSGASGVSVEKKRHARELEGGAAGALAGATIGAVAGAPGAIAGAVVGAILGAAAGLAVEKGNEARDAEDGELDAEIGVEDGELGAPNLKHPPAKIGAYSASSAGVHSGESDAEPAEGPIEPPRS
jgi:hypothetical protein